MGNLLFLFLLFGLNKLYFISTQLVPIEEAEWFRKNVLSEFEKRNKIKVIFLGANYGEFQDRINAEYKAKKGKISLAGGLSSDFESIGEAFIDLKNFLSNLKKKKINFLPFALKYNKYKGKTIYIPWLQGTYIFVANKKALEYLPPGVNIDSLTYNDLLLWVKGIWEKTGERKFGLPAGPRGLIHRFLHGYLYPSFTEAQIIKFDSEDAIEMWNYVKNLWKYTNPGSARWEKMDTPLLSEEVWIAWDHISRIKSAIIERPDDFVIFSSPMGKKGRGIIVVLSGLAVPETAPSKDYAFSLIEFLVKPEIQREILKGTGFLPVVENISFEGLEKGIKKIAEGVKKQNSGKNLIVSFIPGGLGNKQGEFTKIYRDVFKEIVIKNKNPMDILPFYKKKIIKLFKEKGASLPPPDNEIK